MRRVAVLGDVHGNAVALAAVFADLREEDVDLVVWTGDLSWGQEPAATLDLVRGLDLPARYVRGNAERALIELRDGTIAGPSERARWILEQHSAGDLAFVEAFELSVSAGIDGLGATCFCHGSPRSDEELLTAETAEARIAAAIGGVAERVLVSGHTHSQYDREVAGIRALNPGSVGMPTREGRAPTGRSSGRASSCGIPSTTSTRPCHASARAGCPIPSRWSRSSRSRRRRPT